MIQRDHPGARKIPDRMDLFAPTPCRSQAHPIPNLAVGSDARVF